MRKLLMAIFVAALCACGPTSSNSSTDANLRHVILYNEDGKPNVALMKDTDAVLAVFKMLKSPSGETIAQFKAAQVDGRIFQIATGTRADVLKDVPVPGATESILRIRIVNGPHANEEAFCFSASAQQDTSR